MIDISVKGLVKSFEVGSVLLNDLSFDIHEGECVGSGVCDDRGE